MRHGKSLVRRRRATKPVFDLNPAEALRDCKSAKNECEKTHFAGLAEGENSPARYLVATKLEDVL